ncbi:DUF2577 domain-containing protein [Clostridium sp. AM27-31LB]|nr:MAG: hypothetical protein BHW08_01475 [Clostridium sp. CAG:12237_41]RHT94201.1 DUF2577 domain-containing protein [Clostridium sp. AM27-31LB]
MSVANSSIVQLIKQMAVEAVKASRPCDYIVGNVIGTDPLKIKVSNSLVIEDDFLVKTRNVTDYVQEVGEGVAKKNVKIYNSLKEGDSVLMFRKAGGQEYIVVDRMVADDT